VVIDRSATLPVERSARIGSLEQRVTELARRLGPARLRAIRHALTVVGLVSLPYVYLVNQSKSMFGFDAYAYWAIDLGDLYGRSLGNTSDLGAFRYTPAFGQVFAPLHALPWEVFLAGWCIAMGAALLWLGGRWALLLLAFPPIPLELYHGNIHLFMAVAIVIGFRHPIAWAFIILSGATSHSRSAVRRPSRLGATFLSRTCGPST
jgi:hypothetical protein